MYAPIGTPIAMLGRMYGMSAMLCDRVEPGVAVRHRREARFGEPDEAERCAKVLLRQPLVAQHHRQRRSRNRRHRVEHADAAAEHEPDRPLGLDRPSISCGLKQDQRQQHDERAEPQPARVDHRHDRGAEDHAWQQADHDRQHAPPHARQCVAIHPQHVGVERQLRSGPARD